jgi:hypothetical protein
MNTDLIDGEFLANYQAKGYALVRGMFGEDQIGLLGNAARKDRELDAHAFGRSDGAGHVVRLSLWNHPGDTLYGMFARCESIVRTAAALLGGEVYHYHSKMIMKSLFQCKMSLNARRVSNAE